MSKTSNPYQWENFLGTYEDYQRYNPDYTDEFLWKKVRDDVMQMKFKKIYMAYGFLPEIAMRQFHDTSRSPFQPQRSPGWELRAMAPVSICTTPSLPFPRPTSCTRMSWPKDTLPQSRL